MIQTETRNATLTDLMALLREQHARKLDVVVPAVALRSIDGVIRITGTEPVLTEDGVTLADGLYLPTSVADGHIADRLQIPVKYLRRMRETRPDLYDANVNGWLHGRRPLMRGEEVIREASAADARSFLGRMFKGDDTDITGILRALLSDRYGVMDHIDVLMASLDGIKAAGVNVDIAACNLTETRMTVKVTAPEVQAYAPELLKGYRSPFTGATGDENPTVFAGFILSNSETGGGAFTITPQITVQVCANGMTITKDAMKQVHLGGRLEEGVIRWGEDTQNKALELVQAKTRDAVSTFLDVDYVTQTITRLEEKAGEPVAQDKVRDITKALKYTETQIDGILGYFIAGQQNTLGGVVNAVTAWSQTLENPDEAYDADTRVMALLGV